MRFDDVVIASLASVHAPQRVATAELEGQLDLPKLGLLPGTLEALSGITARRFFDADVQPSQAATKAAVEALDGIDRG